MRDEMRRSGPRVFGDLLLKGQRVDWRYSLVVILVITGMFSTPLVLGSIRNRVYVAVKEQIEKENNAREISLHLAEDEAQPLDDALIEELKAAFPSIEAVGNHKMVVSVEGPEGSDFLTLQTLDPGDPRSDPLRIVPGVPPDFGFTDLVISDSLGRLLYGESWDASWSDQPGAVTREPLTLRINDLLLTPELRVVARRTLPGRGLYASPAAGAALRRYTKGFGAPELGLPIDEGLVQYSLPKMATGSCTLLLDEADATCDETDRQGLRRRFEEMQLEVLPAPLSRLPAAPGFLAVGVGLREVVDEQGKAIVREARGDCQEILAPHLVDRCSSTLVVPDLAVDLVLERAEGETMTASVIGIPPEAQDLLPGIRELRDLHGTAPPAPDGAIHLTVAIESGLALGEQLGLRLGDESVPARVGGFYACADSEQCPAFAGSLETFRLHNLAEGSIRVQSRDPLVFVPVGIGTEYDEVLVYVPEVEQVEAVSDQLRARYPGYNVQYNVAALDKLRRQDSRLSALFNLTIVLSALFIVLALGALARINIERRSRQMAQMLILGFSRAFVRRLVVAEYLLLTAASALASLGLTAILCLAARTLLRSTTGESSVDSGFQVIIESMNVDPGAFLQVFAVVAVCTWLIAVSSARKAARTDPLNLLD